MDSRYYASLLIHMMNDGTVFLLPSVLPLIVLQYGFSYATAGYISAIIPLCLGVFQTPIGRISDRFSNAFLLRIGILIVSAGALLAGLAPQLLIPSLFLIGTGGSFYHPVGYAFTAKIVKNSSSGTVLGIQSSSGDIGTLAAFLTAGPIAIFAGWQAVFVVWGIAGAAVLAISSVVLRGEKGSSETSKPTSLSMLRKREAVLIMILFALLGAVYRILATFIPSIFFLEGASITTADYISAILIGAGIVGGIVGGRLVDRFEGRTVAVSLFALSTAALFAMYLLPSIFISALLVAIFGMVITGLYPAFYFLMRLVTSVKIVGTSYGLLLSLGMLSGIVSVTAGGYIMDTSPPMIFIFAASLTALGVLISLKMPKMNGMK